MVKTMPISQGIRAIQHNKLYTVHRYFARRPHNVIGHLIDHYTDKPSSLILDPFGGGGTTLIEALSREHRVITYDTSDLSCFIMEQEAMMGECNIEYLSEFFNQVIKDTINEFGSCYQFADNEIYWISWVTTLSCPNCEQKTILDSETSTGSGIYKCINCGKILRPKIVNTESVVPIGLCLMKTGSMLNGKPNGEHIVSCNEDELKNFYKKMVDYMKSKGINEAFENRVEIPDCNLQRESALHKKGIRYFEQFIPLASRGIIEYVANKTLNSSLGELDKRRILFILSASLRYFSRFSCINSSWRSDTRPLEWAKSNFWTPYSFVEVNPIIAFSERWKSYKAAVKSAKQKMVLSHPAQGTNTDVLDKSKTFSINNCSSEALSDIPDSSVDLVLTDPPYGSYLHYGELSGFWTCWLSRYIPGIRPIPERTKEAVPARKKGYPGWKTFDEYEGILASVFAECFRVLKYDHYCVVTFNNREPEAWLAFLRAVKRAGFSLPNGGVVFQDGVESYKQSIDLRRNGAIHGDFIYSFVKNPSQTNRIEEALNWQQIVEEMLQENCVKNKVISNSDLYSSINLALLPRLYRSIDCRGQNSNNFKDFTSRNLDELIKKYMIREDNMWSSRSS